MINETYNYDLTNPMTPQMLALIIILSIFAILGSIGNSLSTFVFYKVRDKSTAQIFILTMSVIDLFTCTVIIPFTIVVEYLAYDIKYDIVCKLYQFMITSKVPLSAFIMVAISFDRYFCICHPLRRIVTPFRMKITLICLTSFACMLGIITCLAYGVYSEASVPSYQLADDHHSMIVEGMRNKFLDWRPMVDEPLPSNDLTNVVLSSIREFLNKRNLSQVISTVSKTDQIVYIGICSPNNLILNLKFVNIYQKFYTVLFVVCLVTVCVLYGLIYRFIQIRRSKKLHQKLVLCSYMNGDHGFEGTRLTLLNGGDEEQGKAEKESLSGDEPAKTEKRKNSDNRVSSYIYDAEKLRDETRAANIKTAIMLFTVTAVFIVAFTPAWLMAHKFIPTNIVVFYMYFSYNVANPCIYAFMNPVFQDNLKRIFRRS